MNKKHNNSKRYYYFFIILIIISCIVLLYNSSTGKNVKTQKLSLKNNSKVKEKKVTPRPHLNEPENKKAILETHKTNKSHELKVVIPKSILGILNKYLPHFTSVAYDDCPTNYQVITQESSNASREDCKYAISAEEEIIAIYINTRLNLYNYDILTPEGDEYVAKIQVHLNFYDQLEALKFYSQGHSIVKVNFKNNLAINTLQKNHIDSNIMDALEEIGHSKNKDYRYNKTKSLLKILSNILKDICTESNHPVTCHNKDILNQLDFNKYEYLLKNKKREAI